MYGGGVTRKSPTIDPPQGSDHERNPRPARSGRKETRAGRHRNERRESDENVRDLDTDSGGDMRCSVGSGAICHAEHTTVVTTGRR